MPPALSDDESSDQSEIAAPITRPTRKATSTAPIATVSDTNMDEVEDTKGDSAGEGDEDDEDDEDLDEDVFIVESIKNHLISEDGSIKFQVKWEGYDKPKDMTWEPEENLKESAEEILDLYFDKVGGREAILDETARAAKTKKRRRTTNGGTPNNTTKRSRRNGVHPAETTPPATVKKWSPPAGSWEDDIETIDACEDEGSGKLIVYLIWKNGQKTKHETHIIYKKCPQKMLQFYERHVKIIRDENKALDG